MPYLVIPFLGGNRLLFPVFFSRGFFFDVFYVFVSHFSSRNVSFLFEAFVEEMFDSDKLNESVKHELVLQVYKTIFFPYSLGGLILEYM